MTMNITPKEFKIEKTKNRIKHNKLFIFLNGITRNSNDWILVEQELKKINFNSNKIFNTALKKPLNNSIFKSTSLLVNSIIFLFKPILTSKNLNKNILFYKIEILIFLLLAVKINNKIYSKPQLKSLLTINYTNSTRLFYKFLVSNTKTIF
jgi:hypothetical protein